MQVTVTTSQHDGVFVLAFGGDIDVASAVTVRDALDRVIAAGHHTIVLDLSEVRFLDSTGLGVMVGRLKAVRDLEGDMHLVCTSRRIQRVMSITGLDDVFAIHASVDEAVAALGDESAEPALAD
ncbi:MAG: STAS domain-containing protein [Actinomycetia bacterium]|nr:STAS domain-containing protein [Actinomycetes bacterium]